MTCIRDRLWLWGHEVGSHNDQYGLSGQSCITPAEGAYYLGVPNLIMVTYAGKPEPPFDLHARALAPLKRVIWSIVGDSSSKRNDECTDLEEVIRLADRYPNITGAIMDDFFNAEPDAQSAAGRYSPEDIANFGQRLHSAPRGLDLWVVLYSHQLDFPVARHLEMCDGVTFWMWKAEELSNIDSSFQRLERLAPNSRKMLGCYMWDYGVGSPMPAEQMTRQCEIGLQWLCEGRVEGMIFLASCICDLNLEAVEWTRSWIARVGDRLL